MQSCSKRLSIPATTTYYTTEKAIKIVEEILNSQYRRDITSVYVNSTFYKIGLLKNISTQTYSTSYIKYQIVPYNEINGFMLIKYSKHYNLLIKNRKGKEINKVICSNLNAIYAFLDAVRNLKGEVKQSNPKNNYNVISASDLALQKGLTFFKTGKIQDAIEESNTALQFDTTNVDAFFLRALCRNKNNDKLGAIQDYNAIIKRINTATPKYFLIGTVYNNLGYILVEIGKLDETLPYINKALSIEPNETYIWESRGEIFFKKGEYEKAIQDMTKSIELYELKTTKAESQFPDLSYYYRGLAEIKIGKIRKGCNDLKEASEAGNKDADIAIKEYCNLTNSLLTEDSIDSKK